MRIIGKLELEINILESTENIMGDGRLSELIRKIKTETESCPHVKINITCGQIKN